MMATPARAMPARAMPARALAVFGVLWACAAIFHQTAYPALVFRMAGLLVLLPAIWLLLEPSSVPRLGAMALLQVVAVLWQGVARVSNHWIVVTAVNAAIVLAILRLLVVHRRRVEPGELLADVAPAGRASLLVLYFFAVFHKLNADFLDPAVSCATTQYADLVALYPFLPVGAWVDYTVIVGTLVVETLIPLLLLVRRTRVLAVIVGAAFHIVLAFNPDHTFFDFTSMLFALYFLFVPFAYGSAAREQAMGLPAVRRFVERGGERVLQRVVQAGLLAVAVGLVAGYLLRVQPSGAAALNAITEAVRVAFVLYSIVVVSVFVAVVRRHDVVGEGAPLTGSRFGHPLLALPAVLLLLNGFTPYLGLKTEASFAMFSNLRTEGNRSNHLVLPAGVRVAGYQEDLVRIIESSNGHLRGYAREGLLLPFVEFRAQASARPTASVVYERGGQVHEVARIADAPELRSLSLAERNFLRFRGVDAASPKQRCRH